MAARYSEDVDPAAETTYGPKLYFRRYAVKLLYNCTVAVRFPVKTIDV